MLKETFDFRNRVTTNEDFKLDGVDVVKRMVDRLLENLYLPNTNTHLGYVTNCWVLDSGKLIEYGLDEEPINWGDLGCSDVEYIESMDSAHYKITIEEAMPDECPNLCFYIERILEEWGWNVEVVTEW